MVTPKQLGHLVIRVRDLEKSEQFYTNVLGLKVMNKRPGVMTFMSADEGMSHELALVPVAEDAPGPEATRVGLFHMAWEMQSFEDLKQLYEVIKENDVTVENVGDHGISLGVYFCDPDGNEIEAYYEMPKDEWPAEGDLFEGAFPDSLED
jgi:catechol-2,3-dioxygenase